MHVRPYVASDLDRLYEICLRTGDAGEDATELVVEPRLFGELYAAPYGVLEPEHAFVVDDGAGTAIGYASVPSTRVRSTPAARPTGGRRCERGTRSAPAATTSTSCSSRCSTTGTAAADAVVDAYPSHLHIDLLPEAQGAGWGRALMETMQDALRADGSPGVHLGVSARNQRALALLPPPRLRDAVVRRRRLTLGLRL